MTRLFPDICAIYLKHHQRDVITSDIDHKWLLIALMHQLGSLYGELINKEKSIMKEFVSKS